MTNFPDLNVILIHPIQYWRFALLYLASLGIVGSALKLWFASGDWWRRKQLVAFRLGVIERQLRDIESRLNMLDLHQAANEGDLGASWALGLMKWIKENPDEAYRRLHKVPPDACALRCPADSDECWQNNCLRIGDCAFLREHNHASEVERAACEICKFSRHSTLRFRERLREAEDEGRSSKWLPPTVSLVEPERFERIKPK